MIRPPKIGRERIGRLGFIGASFPQTDDMLRSMLRQADSLVHVAGRKDALWKPAQPGVSGLGGSGFGKIPKVEVHSAVILTVGSVSAIADCLLAAALYPKAAE